MMRSIAILGDYEASEFRREIEWLESEFNCQRHPDLDQFAPGSEPEMIVLVQATRGRVAETDVRRIRARFPLTRFVTLLGSWCEGESRSGTPIVGVERIYGHQFIQRMTNQLLGNPRKVLPATVSPEEFWLENAQPDPRADSTNGLAGEKVLVFSTDRSMGSAVATACQQIGFQAIATTCDSPVVAPNVRLLIYDADRNLEKRAREIRDLSARFADAAIVTLIDFPREHERQQALQHGADAVVSKPFVLNDLFTQLAVLLAKRE